MSSKYNVPKFTESYREAEKSNTILLPVLMVVVVLVSFWLVSISRPDPGEKKEETQMSEAVPDQGEVRDIALASPPKINFPLELDSPETWAGAPDGSIPAPPVGSPRLSEDGALPIVDPRGSAGRFTAWMTPEEMNRHILELNRGHRVSFWERGHWITAVEGRRHEGVQEFRIIYESAPRDRDFQWRYRIAQSGEDFARNLEENSDLGFTLVHSQVFFDSDNIRRYQAVWHRVE